MLKTILLDLDGVLNTYTGGYNEDYIPQIKQGAYEFLESLSKNYKVKIFTSRNLFKVTEWLIENNLKQALSKKFIFFSFQFSLYILKF